MKNRYFITIILFFVFFICKSQTLPIDGITYTIDTLENHQIGPGTQYVSLRLTAPSKRIDVYFLKTDLKNPHVEIRAALGRDSIYSGERPSDLAKRKSTEGNFYFAGTNGDFYETAGYVGYPVSGNMIDSEIAKIPGNRNVFSIDDQKIPDIGIMTYSGSIQSGTSTWSIHSVNHLRGNDKLVLYNRYNGKTTRTNQYGTEVLIELLEGNTWGSNKTLRAKVINKEAGVGNMAIPAGKAVLSGHGTAADELNLLSVNDEIDIRLDLTLNENNISNFIQMTGGDNYATMLFNGVVEQASVWNELHPRTGLGFNQNKDSVIFCVVDGRGVSNGATTKQLAILMKSAGAWTAFNMDGGGSSAMYVAEYGGPVNKVADGTERAVSNSIFVVSTAPTDNEIGELIPYESVVSLPRYGQYIPHFRGYNQYGILLNSDLEGVVLSCPETLGKIEGDKFIATGTTSGEITATYNGTVTAKINVTLVPVSELKIRLDSVLVDNRSDYPIEVLATTDAGDVLITPNALNWSVSNTDICRIDDGILKALKNGTTTVTGQIGDVTDEMKINVEIPIAPTMIGDSLKVSEWTLSASNFLNAQLNTENLPGPWEHGAAVNFNHSEGRSPFIKLTHKNDLYGLPDTVKIVMNVGDMVVSRAIVSLRANNSSKVVTTELDAFKQNIDFSLDIPVDQIFDTNDRAVYPIWFDNINFYLSASDMTEGEAYTLAVKDILLVYRDFIISGLQDKKTNGFSIYPNPVTNGEFFIMLNEGSREPVTIQIYEITGHLVYSNRLNSADGQFKIQAKDLVSGVYILRVAQKDKAASVKLIVGK